MKKIKIIIGFIILTLISLFVLNYYFNFEENRTKYEQKYNKTIYTYILAGALKHTGVHKSDRLLTYKELFSINHILPESKTTDFNLSDIAPRDTEIYVPFSDYKINWSELDNINQLVKLDIRKKYANLIINYRKEHKKTTWSEIGNISGIGPKTIQKLKNFLILD